VQDRMVTQAEALSEPIRETIRRINWQHAHKAAGVVWDNLYLLAIPVDGSAHNNFIVAYDLLDGGWYEITGWEVGDWQKVKFPDEEDQLYFGVADQSAAGEVYLAFDEDANDDDGVDIDAQIVTARYDAGTKDVLKLPMYVDVFTDTEVDGEFEIYVQTEQQEWTLLGTIEIDTGGLSFPITFPIEFGVSGLQRDRFRLNDLGYVREMQFKFVATGEFQSRIISAVVRFAADAGSWS
jgi:hypothetical protein